MSYCFIFHLLHFPITGAKTRWESLRAQYRKYLAKLKTKSCQAASKIAKWRYCEQMQFLNDFVNIDRPRPSSIIDNETERTGEIENEESNAQPSSARKLDENDEVEPTGHIVNTFTKATPVASKVKNKQGNIQQENASSTLMKYILEKKKSRTRNSSDG